MHANTISQRCLLPLLADIHSRRLTTLLEAVASCVRGAALSLTDIGRRFAGTGLLCHKRDFSPRCRSLSERRRGLGWTSR
jgi:hypothetical protein